MDGSKTAVQEISAPPEGDGDEKGEEHELRPMASFMPAVNAERGFWHDLTSLRVWRNHIIWRAGVSLTLRPLEHER